MTAIDDRTPANENCNPFLRADTAQDELYRLRREMMAIPADLFTLEQWMERERALNQANRAIDMCLGLL